MSNPFDGTWTMILGDQAADPETNSRYVIDRATAWDEDKPDNIGTCNASDNGFILTLMTEDKQGHFWTETLHAIGDVADLSLSGMLHYAGPDGIEFDDPCRLVRFDVHTKPPSENFSFGLRKSR